jgi:hypothetical protein
VKRLNHNDSVEMQWKSRGGGEAVNPEWSQAFKYESQRSGSVPKLFSIMGSARKIDEPSLGK